MSDNLCKFVKLRKQITYDGVHWLSTDEYKKGDFLEYECVFQGKFQAVYLDSRIYSEECDSTSATTLTTADTKPSGYEHTAMTSAVIGDCVTTIGNYAFSGFTNLSAVTIGSGVTSVGDRAFYDCRSLTSITIPSGVTSIGIWSFTNCRSLTSITCLATTPPALQLFAFNNTNNCPIYVPCESVEAYKTARRWSTYANRIQGIPPCSEPQYRQTSGTPYCTGVDKYQDVYDQVSYDGGTTWRTTATTSVLIEAQSTDCGFVPPFDGKFSATYTGGATYNEECDSATTLTTADTKPSGYEYSAMTSAVIGDCVTTIDTIAFNGCKSLSSITIPDSVTSIGDWSFTACVSLSSLTIPDSVTSIGDYAFHNCSGLASITIEATTPPTLGSRVFELTNCPIYVPCASVNAYKAASGWSSYASRIQGIPPCSEPQYRQTSGTPYCTGVDKYQDVYDQVSYDGGTSWETTATTSVLIENNSYDCGYRERTTSGTPYCNGYDKYQDVYNEYSTDSGSTWITASTVPTLVEAQSTDCGYVPSSFKLASYISGAHYIRGTLTGTIYGTNGFSASFEHSSGSATQTLVDNIEGTLSTYGYVMDSNYNTIEPYKAITKTITITTIEGIIYTIRLYIGKGLKGELTTLKNK